MVEMVKGYRGNAEKTITDYLHGKGYEQLEGSIRRLMPVSDRNKEHAKDGRSLRDREAGSNLSVTVGTTSKYHYLYFPDDGTKTMRHRGERFFFFQGAKDEEKNIIDGILEKMKFPK